MTIPELVSSVFILCELKLPARQERMYILDNKIWFLSFVFLDFTPMNLLTKQMSIEFKNCFKEGKTSAYPKKKKKTLLVWVENKKQIVKPNNCT